ncbi:hypothetical protein Cgig2_012180 [Carnegiea gigantea]|uniref:Uncharacterized protein n=1 Tax=Carnegiea gigantea TaxID=171969 RepID=A0A9Q1KTH1_9CARY|nr:hypothetical protein Cgig2_012180 [Carnegiea gigantea]
MEAVLIKALLVLDRNDAPKNRSLIVGKDWRKSFSRNLEVRMDKDINIEAVPDTNDRVGYGDESGTGVYGGGSGRSSNTRNWGNADKLQGTESDDGMTMDGTGGGSYHGGSSNLATGGLDLGVRGQGVENFGQSNGGEMMQGPNTNMGFAGFTASQVSIFVNIENLDVV